MTTFRCDIYKMSSNIQKNLTKLLLIHILIMKGDMILMTSNAIVREKILTYKENEIIMASKFYRKELACQVTEEAFYKTLERMCKENELVKIAKGTYHLPKISKYGIVPPSDEEMVSSFTKNNTGIIIGYSLYNELGLTTQVPKSVLVMSNALDGITKNIRNIEIKRVNIDFSKEIKNMIRGLDVLQNFNIIQDLNYSAFIKFTEQFALSFKENIFEKVNDAIKYKKSTISFLYEILKYYGVNNDLGNHLSSLSEYKHPKMEEIYEAARIQRGF